MTSDTVSGQPIAEGPYTGGEVRVFRTEPLPDGGHGRYTRRGQPPDQQASGLAARPFRMTAIARIRARMREEAATGPGDRRDGPEVGSSNERSDWIGGDSRENCQPG